MISDYEALPIVFISQGTPTEQEIDLDDIQGERREL